MIRRKALSFICLFIILVLGYWVTLCLFGFCSPSFDKYLLCLQYPGVLVASVILMNKTGKDLSPHIFYSIRCRQVIINKSIRQPLVLTIVDFFSNRKRYEDRGSRDVYNPKYDCQSRLH